MLPPRPPSPPSGPPRGTNFSRLMEALPSPPLPAMTSIFASSKNFIFWLRYPRLKHRDHRGGTETTEGASFPSDIGERDTDSQGDEGQARKYVETLADR